MKLRQQQNTPFIKGIILQKKEQILPELIKQSSDESHNAIRYNQKSTNIQNDLFVNKSTFTQPSMQRQPTPNTPIRENIIEINQNISDIDENELNIIQKKLLQKSYYLEKFLSKGGEGYVYSGYQKNIDQTKKGVALKIMRNQNEQNIALEIKIMQSFEKPVNMVEYIDCIHITKNMFVYVFERCKHSLLMELQNMIQSGQIFTEYTLLQMITDLLDGLIQLRFYKILHFDIKPANILLTYLGNYVYSDFGTSQQQQGDIKIKQTTGYTSGYASREMLNNNETKTFRSDIYSLGKTLNFIIRIYQQYGTNNQELIINLKKIIDDCMLSEQKNMRTECTELHQKFFDLIKRLQPEFYNQFKYSLKINQILSVNQYDDKKDIIYFQRVKLYYLQVQEKLIYKDSSTQQAQADISLQIANQCYELGNYEDALKYSECSLRIRKTLLSENNFQIAMSLETIGNCKYELNDIKGALDCFISSNNILKTFHSHKQLNLVTSFNNIKKCIRKIEGMQSALKYLKESIQICKSLLINEGIELPNLNEDCDNNNNYLMYSLVYLEILKWFFKKNPPNIADQLFEVGQLYEKLVDFGNAFSFLQQCDQIQQRIYNDKHNKRIRTLHLLKQYNKKQIQINCTTYENIKNKVASYFQMIKQSISETCSSTQSNSSNLSCHSNNQEFSIKDLYIEKNIELLKEKKGIFGNQQGDKYLQVFIEIQNELEKYGYTEFSFFDRQKCFFVLAKNKTTNFRNIIYAIPVKDAQLKNISENIKQSEKEKKLYDQCGKSASLADLQQFINDERNKYHYFIFKEYKGTLKQLISSRPDKRLNELSTIKYAKDIAEAYLFLHKNKCILSNILFDNIYIDFNDKALIGDIGMVSIGNANYNNQDGKIGYMAPECLANNLMIKNNMIMNNKSEKSDAFSFGMISFKGCLIFSMIYGEQNYLKQMNTMKEQPLQFGNHLESFQYGQQLKEIILGLTRVNPEERTSIDSVRYTLKGILDTELNFEFWIDSLMKEGDPNELKKHVAKIKEQSNHPDKDKKIGLQQIIKNYSSPQIDGDQVSKQIFLQPQPKPFCKAQEQNKNEKFHQLQTPTFQQQGMIEKTPQVNY